MARFDEAMATIRSLWNSGGQLVIRDSPFFPLHNAIFDLPAYKGKWPEIWIAAHMPRMLRITGRYADAWFPAFIFDAKSYAAGLEVIRGAASDAGRDPASIIPANWHIVVTGRSRDEVDEALSCDVMKALALNLPAGIWANHGSAIRLAQTSSAVRTWCRKSSTKRLCSPIRAIFRRQCSRNAFSPALPMM